MLKIARQAYKNLFVRLTFLVALLMAIFSYSHGHFIFVQAYNNQVNIFPGSFAVEPANNILTWQNPANAFVQDLSAQAGFILFGQTNSTYIVSANYSPDLEPAVASTTNETTAEQLEPPAPAD